MGGGRDTGEQDLTEQFWEEQTQRNMQTDVGCSKVSKQSTLLLPPHPPSLLVSCNIQIFFDIILLHEHEGHQPWKSLLEQLDNIKIKQFNINFAKARHL